MAVPVAAELLAEVRVLAGRLGRGLLGQVGTRRLALERAAARLGDPRRLIDERRQGLDDFVDRAGRVLDGAIARRRKDLQIAEGRLLRAHPQRRIADQRTALGLLERRLGQASSLLLGHRRRAFDALANKLDALSPLKILERGYSLTRGPDGAVLSSRQGLAPGDQVTVTLRDGDLRTRIEEILARKQNES
jgi:exodeoxyribonuclease VII large subunit